MSAEDSVEIQFPSLARLPNAPEPAPEADLDPGTNNDLAWLAGIFSDDDEEESDLAGVPEPDGPASDQSVEPPPEPEDFDAIDTTDTADLTKLIEEAVVATDPSSEPAPTDSLGVGSDTVASVRAPRPSPGQADVSDPPVPPSTEHPLPGLPRPKKVTGFREEIISTFSQLYE